MSQKPNSGLEQEFERRVRRGKRMLRLSLLFLGISLLTLLTGGVLFLHGCNLAYF